MVPGGPTAYVYAPTVAGVVGLVVVVAGGLAGLPLVSIGMALVLGGLAAAAGAFVVHGLRRRPG